MVAVGGLAAQSRPIGLGRAMIGAAVMQVMLGLLLATAPGGTSSALLSCGALALSWLISAGFFFAAARTNGR